MYRVVIRISALVFCLLLILPTLSVSSAGKTFVEGIHLDAAETHHNALRITIDAIKRVEGQSRRSEIHISYHYAYVDGNRDFDATVTVDGDPDSLEVSRDLGWGGLDTVIYVQQRRIDCTFNPDRVCGPEIIETVPVEIHLGVGPSDATWQDGNLFKRNASGGGISGSIKTPNLLTSLNFGQGMATSGYNFSDQSPR